MVRLPLVAFLGPFFATVLLACAGGGSGFADLDDYFDDAGPNTDARPSTDARATDGGGATPRDSGGRDTGIADANRDTGARDTGTIDSGGPGPQPTCTALATEPVAPSPITWSGQPACSLDGFCTVYPAPIADRPVAISAAPTGSTWAAYGDSAYAWNGRTGRVHKVPVQHEIQSIWAVSDTDVWVAGYESTIAHFNGVSWDVEQLTFGSALGGIWARNASDVWAVGNFGVVGHYNGATWTASRLTGEPSLDAVYGLSANDVWAAGFSGGIWHYDGTWTKTAFGAGGRWSAIWASSATDVWIVGDVGILRGSVSNLAPVTIPNVTGGFSSVWGSGPSDVYVGGSSAIYHWNGQSWSTTGTNGGHWITGRGSNDVWTYDNLVMKHFDNGAWKEAFPIGFASLNGMWRNPTNGDMWFVGNAGTVLRHRSAGGAMDKVTLPTTRSMYAIWGASDTDLWILGEGDRAFHILGTQMCSVALPHTAQVTSASGSSASDIWAVTPTGRALHYDGKAWLSADDIRARHVLAFGERDVWAAGSRLLHYDGAGWTEPSHSWTTQANESFGPLSGSSASDIWSVRDVTFQGSKMIHFTGGSWTETTQSGTLVDAISAVSATDVWAFASGVQHYTSSGWADLSTSRVRRSQISSAIATSTEVWFAASTGEIGKLTR